MEKIKSIIFWGIVSGSLVLSYLLIGNLLEFAEGKSPIITELMAAILGSIITVAAMAAMIKMQARQEKEKEATAKVFEYKVQLYNDLLNDIFRCDDDNVLSDTEINEIENKIGIACLVAGESLVSAFAQFVWQLKLFGVMYFRTMTNEKSEPEKARFEHFIKKLNDELKKSAQESVLSFNKHSLKGKYNAEKNPERYFISLDELLQEMRKDLDVVEGNIQNEVEHFVRLKINEDNIIPGPNIVYERRHKQQDNLRRRKEDRAQ
jgi:hypothetical protein